VSKIFSKSIIGNSSRLYCSQSSEHSKILVQKCLEQVFPEESTRFANSRCFENNSEKLKSIQSGQKRRAQMKINEEKK